MHHVRKHFRILPRPLNPRHSYLPRPPLRILLPVPLHRNGRYDLDHIRNVTLITRYVTVNPFVLRDKNLEGAFLLTGKFYESAFIASTGVNGGHALPCVAVGRIRMLKHAPA